ncbi:MAG: SDR family NAD(P)-dependent oxidoreductase [Chitinophagaceae bacterium]|nr:SDR family NAD(P)-dependent oxidoreductase [Chitinophagaceae bacterium]
MSKNILITGVTGNLGQAVAQRFLAEGYNVIGTVLPGDTIEMNFDTTGLEKIIVDLLDVGAVEKMLKGLIARIGNIDVAVLTVGGFAMADIAGTKTADIEKQYKLNFETAYNVVQPLFPYMKEKGKGHIFMIGSRPGLSASFSKGMIAYGLSKSLIFRLAELMNEEAKGTDVVTSVIVPSTIDTPQNRKSMPDADFDSWVNPGDIASVIHFYCTGEGSVVREGVIKVYNKS